MWISAVGSSRGVSADKRAWPVNEASESIICVPLSGWLDLMPLSLSSRSRVVSWRWVFASMNGYAAEISKHSIPIGSTQAIGTGRYLDPVLSKRGQLPSSTERCHDGNTIGSRCCSKGPFG